MNKYITYILAILLLASATRAHAAINYTPTLLPLTDSLYDIGTTTKAYRQLWVDEFCLTADTCYTSIPGVGDMPVYLSTTSPWTAGDLAQVNSDGSVNSIATSSLGLSTTDIKEGTKLFYTDARVQSELLNGDNAVFGNATTTNLFATSTEIVSLSIGGNEYDGTELAMLFSTGVIATAGETEFVVASTSASHFGVNAGSGLIVDPYTDPNNPKIYKVSWAASSSIAVTVPPHESYVVSIDKNGNINQTEYRTFYDDGHQFSKIAIGGFALNGGTIGAVGTEGFALSNIGGQLYQFFKDYGDYNLSGNVYYNEFSNLSISKTAGQARVFGGNIIGDPSNPNTATSSAQSNITYVVQYRDGVGGFTTTFASTIDAGHYDDGDGTLGVVNNNQWQRMRIYFRPENGLTLVTYGQDIYNSYADALASISIDLPELSDAVGYNILCNYLIVRGGATDLSNTDDAVFITHIKGEGGGAGSAGSALADMQDTYNHTLDEPEITTDTTRGAVSIQGGTGSDASSSIDILNNTGATVGSWYAHGGILTKGTSTLATTTISNVILGGVVNFFSQTWTQLSDFVTYARGLFSNTATGLTYNSSTGETSLTAGYVIPTTASTTEWATAYGWGDHSLAGYLTSESDPVFNAASSSFMTYAAWDATTTDALTEGPVNLYNQTHTGEVTGATALTIADNIVDEANLKLDTGPTDGYVLTASSTASGGLEWKTAGGTGTVTSVAATVPTGWTITGSPITTAGTLGLSYAAGYGAVLTASTTEWATAYGWGDHSTQGYLTSVDISDNTNLSVTATGLELSGDAVALSAGYLIPLTASTTNWNGFYDTPSTRITAGTGLSWSGNTLNAEVQTSDLHDAVTLAGEDFLSLSGQQITANAINADNLSASDFGDFSCNGTTCSFDANTIDTTELVLSMAPTWTGTHIFTATTTLATTTVTSLSGKDISGNTTPIVPDFDKSFAIASTSPDFSGVDLTAGTTTWEIWHPSRAITVNSIYCDTDTGTALVRVGDGTNWTEGVACSATPTADTSLSNNTFNARESFIIQIGTGASSPNRVTPTFNFSYQ